MNWELMSPLIDVLPPPIPPPRILTNELPSLSWRLDSVPSCLRLCRRGATGLLSRDDPKVKIEDSEARAATGIIKRKVAPDSPQSIGLFGALSDSTPLTLQQFSRRSISAPKASTARKVDLVSSETRGLDIFEVPFDNNAAINILCV